METESLPGAQQLDITSYERLRSWYLAHLRKSLLIGDASEGVTPITLVKRDKAALEKLVADAVGQQPSAQKVANSNGTNLSSPPKSLFLSFITVSSIAAFFLLTAPFGHAHIDFAARCTTIIFLFSLCIWLFSLTKELKNTQARLASTTQHEQDIADYAFEAFWSIDLNFKFIAVNPTFKRITRITSSTLLNMSMLELLPQRELENLKNRLDQCRQKRGLQKFETQIKMRDSKVLDLEVSAEYSQSDAVFYCVATDISERKSAERSKEQLMDMLSHDLRTPLSSLALSLALLGTSDYGKLLTEGEKLLKIAESNVTNLIDLINQILDLHKLDVKQMQLSVSEISVQEIIQPALIAVQNLAEKKDVEIMMNIKEFKVRADKGRMTQVIVNLLSNAIKYSPEGGQISIEVKQLPGDWLAEFSIADRGPGIDKRHQPLLFDRFYRVPAADGNKESGTGLGLAICKAIVDAHGGSIFIESEPEKGAKFVCHIQAVKNNS